MKKIKINVSFIMAIMIISIFQSCSNSDEALSTIPQLNEKEMLTIASKHLVNTNNIFSLDINKQEALRLGISSKFYDKMLNDVNKTNAEIEKIQKSNGIIFGLNTAKSDLATKNVRFKTPPEYGQKIDSKYRTTLTATDNAPASQNIGTVNANYIEFKVSSSCLVTPITILVDNGYGIQQITIMSYPFCSGTGRLDLPSSSCNCNITIVTPCSDGSSVGVYFGH